MREGVWSGQREKCHLQAGEKTREREQADTTPVLHSEPVYSDHIWAVFIERWSLYKRSISIA